MNLGFKVTSPPRPPSVLAPQGQPACGREYPHLEGVRCERPCGHGGGHLSASHGRYWQAEAAS